MSMDMKRHISPSTCVLGLALCSTFVGACDGDDEATTNAVPAGAVDSGGVPADSGSGVDGASAAGLHIAGLTAPVRAVYDEFGFLHISGKTDEDAFAALGYFHSANRFFFMDFLRNAIRGTLGKMISAPGIVDRDVTSRTFFATPQGDPLPEKLVAQLDAPTKAAIDAYARGVNAWLADMRASRNGATLTAEYTVASKDIRDWEPADSMAVALFSLNDLSNNAEAEVTLGQVAVKAAALASTKPAVAKALQDLYLDFRPTFDAYTIPAANVRSASLDRPTKGSRRAMKARAPDTHDAALALALAKERLRTLPHTAATAGDTGSNNWVIAGARTRTGRPLLGNDPHLALTNPSIWFPVEIDGKTGGTGTYHAAGGSFPGLPTIQIGHNESIAWGVTVSYWDLADVYLETLTKTGGVSFNGKDVPLVSKPIDFIDQGKTVTKYLAWVPHHGPIISLNLVANTAVSLRWRGHDGSTDPKAFVALGRAGSIVEAKAALGDITTANQNFVIADKQGRIGYFPYSKVPIRAWAAPTPGSSPFFPLPGDGTREWGAPVAVADIPQLQDPPAGFIATANEDITGAFRTGDPLTPAPGNKPIQSTTRSEGTRMQRILDSFATTGAANTIDTMRALQGDTKSLIAQTIVPRLIAAAADTPAGGFALDGKTTAVVTALSAYQAAGLYSCPSGLDGSDPAKSPSTAAADVARESIGCTAFHAALYALFEGAFGDELSDPDVALGSPFDIPNNVVPVLMRSLRNDTYDPKAETFWIDGKVTDHVTTRNEILQRALTKAGAVLATLGAPDTWRWGKVHTLTLRSPLSQAGPTPFDSAPYATPGGLFTVNVANPSVVNIDNVTAKTPLSFAQTNGPSIRTLIEVGTDTPHMKIQLPGGADLHRESAFYNNMIPRWLTNTPVDYAFGAGAVTNPARDLEVLP
jgi:penicillin amidase